jgi:preprotein translocase subunit YajC
MSAAGGPDMIELLTTPSESTQVFTHAQDAVPAGGGGSLVMLLIIFAIFYFLLIRPQQKEQKAHRALVGGLQKGQQVVTTSGLHGRVHEVSDATVVLEVANNVRITVDKVAVKRQQEEG